MQTLSFQFLSTFAEKAFFVKEFLANEKWLIMLGESVQSCEKRCAAVSQAVSWPFQRGSGRPGMPSGPGCCRNVVEFHRKLTRCLLVMIWSPFTLHLSVGEIRLPPFTR